MATDVQTTSNNNGSSTTPNVGTPSGSTTGDLLIAIIAIAQFGTFTLPSGWTAATGTAGSAGNVQVRVYWKPWASGDGTHTWTNNISNAWSIVCMRISEADLNVNPPIDVITMGTLTFNTAISIPSVTNNGDNQLLIGAVATVNARTGTSPGDMTEIIDLNVGRGLKVNKKLLTSAGATGAKTETISSGDNAVGLAFTVWASPLAFTGWGVPL